MIAVISLYKKNIEWTKKLFDIGVKKIYIYDHTQYKDDITNLLSLLDDRYVYNFIPNKGREASAYLRYIINYYDNFEHEEIIFLHDDEISWHHTGSIIQQIKTNLNKAPYTNLNNYVWTRENKYMSEIIFGKKTLYRSWYMYLLSKYIGNHYMDTEFMVGNLGCSQFIINKKSILHHPKKMYEDLYTFCMSRHCKAEHLVESRKKKSTTFACFMEYTWKLILDNDITHEEVEPTEHTQEEDEVEPTEHTQEEDEVEPTEHTQEEDEVEPTELKQEEEEAKPTK